MLKYQVVAPNGRAYLSTNSWIEAVDEAVELTIRWGVRFGVRNLSKTDPPFKHEHQKVYTLGFEYARYAHLATREGSEGRQGRRARTLYHIAKQKLECLLATNNMFKNDEFVQRCSLVGRG